jgi:hypothetical protein
MTRRKESNLETNNLVWLLFCARTSILNTAGQTSSMHAISQVNVVMFGSMSAIDSFQSKLPRSLLLGVQEGTQAGGLARGVG